MAYLITQQFVQEYIKPCIPAKLIDGKFIALIVDDSTNDECYEFRISTWKLLSEAIHTNGYTLDLSPTTSMTFEHLEENGFVEVTIKSDELDGIVKGVQKLVMMLEAPYAKANGTNQATDYMRHRTAIDSE